MIAELLGSGRKGGLIVAFFIATLPLAVLQSTSTQNDLVVSFWIACALYGCVKFCLQRSSQGLIIFAIGLGLALLTKMSALCFGVPLSILMLAGLIAHWRGILPGIMQVGIICTIVVGLNAGHAMRNFNTSGHLLGQEEFSRPGIALFTNDIHGPGAIVSNMIRNAGLHLALFDGGESAKKAVLKIHDLLGLDPLDIRTTFKPSLGYQIMLESENGCAMQTHFLLIIAAGVTMLACFRSFTLMQLAIAMNIGVGAFLFCVILKWQPFHSRLQLPLFVESAPLVALMVQRKAWQKFLLPVVFMMLLGSVWDVLHNPVRPALGGNHALFRASSHSVRFLEQPGLEQPYEAVNRICVVNNVKNVGLIANFDDWEYPLFDRDNLSRWRIDQVLVTTIYAPLETADSPDAVICTEPDRKDVLEIHGKHYRRAFVEVTPSDKTFVLSVYFPEGAPVISP
jgi:hypothetical protein